MQLKEKLFHFFEVDSEYSGMGNDMKGYIHPSVYFMLCGEWQVSGGSGQLTGVTSLSYVGPRH